jgi:hypothetical protein
VEPLQGKALIAASGADINTPKLDIDISFEVLRKVSEGRSAPFFRYPGLNNSAKLNRHLAKRNIAIS